MSVTIWYWSFSNLFHLAWYSLGSSMLSQMVSDSSFLLLHKFPGIHVPQLFFIHSPTDGDSGCFQFLAIGNCAALNIEVHTFFLISFQFSFKSLIRSHYSFVKPYHQTQNKIQTSIHCFQGPIDLVQAPLLRTALCLVLSFPTPLSFWLRTFPRTFPSTWITPLLELLMMFFLSSF